MCFKHLYKKILSLLLILALTIPANAAVSVSDGSAFVSKAEFSTDITNLSNRMAQLENSLDAKIDSLVSSYLSRNGIWNGEKQTVVNNNIAYEVRVASWMNNETGSFSKNFLITSPLAKNVTKSGLLVWSGYWGLGRFGPSTTDYSYIRFRKSGNQSAEYFGLDLQLCTIKNGMSYVYSNATLKNSFSFGTGFRGVINSSNVGTGSGSASFDESNYHSIGSQTHYNSCFFFVDKGDDILINFNAYGYKNSLNTYQWPQEVSAAYIGAKNYTIYIY